MAANVISVPIEHLGDALEQGEERIRNAITYGAIAGAHRGRAYIVPITPSDLGQLRASWKVKEHPTAIAGSATLAELINDAPHIAVVELGARPHKVSAEGWAAIYEWVRRHYRNAGGVGGQFRLGGTGRMKRAAPPPGPFRGADPDVTSITWAIVQKIKKEGQRATLFVRNAIPQLTEIMAYELNRAIAQAQRASSKDGRR